MNHEISDNKEQEKEGRNAESGSETKRKEEQRGKMIKEEVKENEDRRENGTQ